MHKVKSRVTDAAGEANRRNSFRKPSFVKRCQWLLFPVKYRVKKGSRSASRWWKLGEERECRPGYNVFNELETFIDARIEVTNALSISERANRYLRKWFVILARLTSYYYFEIFRSNDASTLREAKFCESLVESAIEGSMEVNEIRSWREKGYAKEF